MSSAERKQTYAIADEEGGEVEETINSIPYKLLEDDEQETMTIEANLAIYEESQEVDAENAEVVVRAREYLNFSAWILMRKLTEFFRVLYTPERRNAFAKNLEKCIFFLVTALLAIGTVIFISFIGYKIYYCNNNSKALLKRISNIQGEKLKLLKIINDFAEQNATFYGLIRNDTEYFV